MKTPINKFRLEVCMKFILLLFFTIAAFTTSAQEVKVIKVGELETIINSKSEKIQVINFWATWCGPCVKELPYFEKAGLELSDQIEVNLVTVDFVEDIEKVKKFVDRKELKSNIYLIDNIDYNSWIDKVDERWSGAIPATLIINPSSGERRFIESELEEGQLEKLIRELQ